MKYLLVILTVFSVYNLNAQLAWPSESWSSAVNLTSIMDATGITELSGLHWNATNNRLYAVQGDGRLRVLQLNTATNTFSQIGNKSISGGPEGITQVDYTANEFYTVDENNYEIRRFSHTSNFQTVTLSKRWDLLASPSPMQDTGNTGPEGIVFIPDSYLSTIGFVSQQTGNLYTSVKGLGGLFFVAHQDGGFVWVFDINPDVDDDFIYVGKYKTNSTESCDLSFDRSTGLLYILHNVSNGNRLEVTNLSTTIVSGNEHKFNITNTYFLPNPSGSNDNIEGFAITPKCTTTSISTWICRDAENDQSSSIRQDVLRWFNPFTADGDCAPLFIDEVFDTKTKIYPNPTSDFVNINSENEITNIRVLDANGRIIESIANGTNRVDVSTLANGVYVLQYETNGKSYTTKVVKK